MSDTVKELRELLASASFSPWHHKQGKEAFNGWPVASFGEADDGQSHWVSVMGRHASEGPTRGADNDAKLVAAMRNALPDLLAVVDAARALPRSCTCTVQSGCRRAALDEAVARLDSGS